MKTHLTIVLAVIALCAGCVGRETRHVVGPDYTYRSARQQLKGQPMSVPAVTPYDGNEELRTVYLSGFKKGWGITLEYWIGNAIAIPEAYQRSTELTKAWQDGCNAGQQAVCERVRTSSSPH